MNGNELKPCPFCGEEAMIITAESMHDGRLFGIMCSVCHSRGDVYDTEAEAVEAWNSRAERTCRFLPFVDGKGDGVCSECESLMYDTDNYCPNCGARVIRE